MIVYHRIGNIFSYFQDLN